MLKIDSAPPSSPTSGSKKGASYSRDIPAISRLAKLRGAATFASYEAAVDTPDIYEFGKRNLIYGFNGCGKTTLSRIFAYLGTGEVPSALPPACEFEFILGDGTIVRSDRNTEILNGRIIVYNEDFIDANFNWQEGTAQPVQLGAGMIADVKRLEELQDTIEKLNDNQKSAAAERRKSEKALSDFCRDTARNIEQTAGTPCSHVYGSTADARIYFPSSLRRLHIERRGLYLSCCDY